jgi:hypothetical protein
MRLPSLPPVLAELIADLRRHRLLPVVGVLVVALIAIPLVLSNSGTSAPPVPVAAAPAQPDPTGVSLQRRKGTAVNGPAGHYRNPFVTQVAATSTASSAASRQGSSARSTSTGAATTSNSSAGTRTTATTTTSTTPTTEATTPVVTKPARAYVHYRVRLALDSAGGQSRVFHDPARFALIPSSKSVAVAFLGVERDGRTAVFLLGNNPVVEGDGRCSPSPSRCSYLTMQPGAQMRIAERPSGRPAVGYRLRYVAVHKAIVKTADTTTSAAGKALIEWAATFMPALKSLRFDRWTGLLSIGLGHTARAPSHS